MPLITPIYFAPLSWKILLRVLYFIAHYRQIGYFRGQPVHDLLAHRAYCSIRWGMYSRGFLSLTVDSGLASVSPECYTVLSEYYGQRQRTTKADHSSELADQAI